MDYWQDQPGSCFQSGRFVSLSTSLLRPASNDPYRPRYSIKNTRFYSYSHHISNLWRLNDRALFNPSPRRPSNTVPTTDAYAPSLPAYPSIRTTVSTGIREPTELTAVVNRIDTRFILGLPGSTRPQSFKCLTVLTRTSLITVTKARERLAARLQRRV